MEPLDLHPNEMENPAFREPPARWLNIYTLPPLAAALVSLIMAALMLKFAYRQVEDLELTSLPLPAIENIPNEGITALDAPARANTAIAVLFTPEVQYWAPKIEAWSREWGLDPDLVATVMQIESCGHPEVISSAGATGLFQVMPFHFKSGESHTHSDTNAMRGLSYLSRSLEAHDGNVYFALAGYNGGIGTSQRAESRWPDETRRYTYWGEGIYSDAAGGKSHSERLDEWLSSGGASLCRRASQALGLVE